MFHVATASFGAPANVSARTGIVPCFRRVYSGPQTVLCYCYFWHIELYSCQCMLMCAAASYVQRSSIASITAGLHYASSIAPEFTVHFCSCRDAPLLPQGLPAAHVSQWLPEPQHRSLRPPRPQPDSPSSPGTELWMPAWHINHISPDCTG